MKHLDTDHTRGLIDWLTDPPECHRWSIIDHFSRGDPWAMMRLDEDDPYMRTESFLDQDSSERWDTVLHYMVRLTYLTKNGNVCKNFLKIYQYFSRLDQNSRPESVMTPSASSYIQVWCGFLRTETGHIVSQNQVSRWTRHTPCSDDQCSQLGFFCKQFLLMETSSQVWYFILQYLDTVATRNLSLVECLNFLFQLSFAKFGKVFSK